MDTLSQPQLDELIRSTPEIGLQTYEFFNDAKETREQAKAEFIDDSVYIPRIDYPMLDPEEIGQTYDVLENLQHAVLRCELSDLVSRAYEGTVEYRLREARFLLQACILNGSSIDEETLHTQAKIHQTINEGLYGDVEPALIDGVVGEVRQMTNETDFVGMAKDLYNEVFESIFPQLTSSDPELGLPRLTPDARAYLSEIIEKRYAIERKSVGKIREQISKEGRSEFSPSDMVEVFDDIIRTRGYQDTITAFISKGKTLAWSSDKAGVAVGDSRDPVEPESEMYGFTIHEEGVHGQRYVNGRSSDIPILGNGLFTIDDEGSADYLAFEEGLASLYQRIADGTPEGWTIENIKHTLNLALAYEGKDFREVYEASWRIRALLAAKNGQLDFATITKSKSLAYDSVLRIFRGTPILRTARLDQTVTYNKDAAYLPGRVSAINFWNQNTGNDTMFDFVLAGKFDPTNKVQRAIAHTATRGIYE